MRLLKTAFHVHTDYSDDCDASVESLLASAERTGTDCITVTDHDTIQGALALSSAAAGRVRVIIGEEISTTDGHLIGLFLRELIEPGQSARRTAELIRAQGGLVIAPHPFNTIFGCSLRERVYEIADLLHAVEVCNAQNLLPFPNSKAAAFASEYHLPPIVGVDMHHRDNLDACYQWLPPFDGAASFLEALRQAHFVEGRHRLSYFAMSALCIARQRMGLGLPARFGRHASAQRPKIRRVKSRPASATSTVHVPSPGI